MNEATSILEPLPWAEFMNLPFDGTCQFTDEEIEKHEKHMEALLEEIKKEQKDAFLQKEAIALKPLVFSNRCPGPAKPYAYYPMSIVTHAYNKGVISSWDIVNYRKWSSKPFKARRTTNISMKQAVHKMRIDVQIRKYFSTV